MKIPFIEGEKKPLLPLHIEFPLFFRGDVMKYTIMGFLQSKLKELGLDVTDALVL